MNLAIINECNRNCPYCFEGAFKAPPGQMMSLDDVERVCRFFNLSAEPPNYRAGIMGGEPTLHPQLLDIIDMVLDFNPYVKLLLLTNLTCDPELTNELIKHRNIQFLLNITHPEHNTQKQQRAVEQNLELLNAAGVVSMLAVTISEPDESFDYLYALLRKDAFRSIKAIRIGISALGYGFQNQFVSEFSQKYGDKYLEIVRSCHAIEPRLEFNNECPVNGCLMSDETVSLLTPRVPNLNRVCLSPNMDILPDLSTQWCFAFHDVPELRIENIFDYPHPAIVNWELTRRMQGVRSRLAAQCDFYDCSNLMCRGPCPAMNYYFHQLVPRQPKEQSSRALRDFGDNLNA